MPIDPAVYAAIDAALLDQADTRSRAQMARDLGVAPSTVGKRARLLGLDDRFATTGTTAATKSAADRRRALRSDLADKILTEDIPLLRKQLHKREWRRTVLVGRGMGEQSVEQVDEDDAVIGKARKDLVTAISSAMGTAINVDKHDLGGEGDNSAALLAELGDTLREYNLTGQVLDPRDQYEADQRAADELEQEGAP